MIPTDQEILAWVQSHGITVGFLQVAYSCLVQALPKPHVRDGRLYLFAYRALHFPAGNLRLLFKKPEGSI